MLSLNPIIEDTLWTMGWTHILQPATPPPKKPPHIHAPSELLQFTQLRLSITSSHPKHRAQGRLTWRLSCFGIAACTHRDALGKRPESKLQFTTDVVPPIAPKTFHPIVLGPHVSALTGSMRRHAGFYPCVMPTLKRFGFWGSWSFGFTRWR